MWLCLWETCHLQVMFIGEEALDAGGVKKVGGTASSVAYNRCRPCLMLVLINISFGLFFHGEEVVVEGGVQKVFFSRLFYLTN